MTAHTRHDAEVLRAAGVRTILEPFSAAADITSTVLNDLLADSGEAQGDEEQGDEGNDDAGRRY